MSRRSRRRRSGRAGETGTLVVGGLLLGVALTGLAAFGYAYATVERRPHLDTVTQCPDDGWRSATVLLLDTSDSLPPAAKQAVSRLLMDEAEAAPPYGLFEVRTLDPGTVGGRLAFSRCNPGDGAGESELTTNVARTHKRWLEQYQQPLSAILNDSLLPIKASASPIMATLQGIAAQRFTGRVAGGIEKRLIIVSDMIEHQADYSQYSGDLSFSKFKGTRAYKKYWTDLSGVSVKIFYIQRLTGRAINSGDHIRFWSDWIQDGKGHLTEAEKLPGAT